MNVVENGIVCPIEDSNFFKFLWENGVEKATIPMIMPYVNPFYRTGNHLRTSFIMNTDDTWYTIEWKVNMVLADDVPSFFLSGQIMQENKVEQTIHEFIGSNYFDSPQDCIETLIKVWKEQYAMYNKELTNNDKVDAAWVKFGF